MSSSVPINDYDEEKDEGEKITLSRWTGIIVLTIAIVLAIVAVVPWQIHLHW